MTQTLAAPLDACADPAAVPACFHCGLPVPEAGAFRVAVLGRPREMCCAGCEAVSRTIVDAGFEGYYETRDLPRGDGVRPADLPPTAIYDDPLAQAQFVANTGEHGREAILMLEGIRCAACVWLNERYLRELPGVKSVSINYATRRAQVVWDEREVRLGAIISAVRALGYDAYPFDPARQGERDAKERRSALWRLFVAGFGAMQVMMYAVPRYIDDTGTLTVEAEQVMRWASLVLTLPVILFACGPFFSSARADLRARRLGIDVPVSLGILAGFAASAWATWAGGGEVYFDSITMLVFLLLASQTMEFSARRAATARLDHLARWMPSFALRLAEGSDATVRVAAHELRAGDRVLVAPGDTVPADGIVLSGFSSADESLLTGESKPVEKAVGARLIGGSINVGQPLEMRVTAAGLETQAAAIGRLIERAAAGKPRLVEAADRIAHALTWVVLAAAAATLAVWLVIDPGRAFWASIAVLMVTCPCALGLAAPIALTSATAALARRGIVLTRAQAIESLVGITDVVFDKTGTLTEGRPGLAQLDLLGAESREACVALAQALEAGSRHPVALALLALPRGAATTLPTGMTHFPGSGIEASVDGRRVRIGTQRFVGEIAGMPPPIPQAAAHQSPVFLGTDSGWLGRFLFEDRVRADAARLVQGLQGLHLTVHVLSGDEPGVVRQVASTLGITVARGGASPQDKHDYVKLLQASGRRVCMVGDGLNDAPVLAQADLSIAMGQGTALAQQQADLVLLSGRLDGVLEAGRIARLAMAAIRQNFGWALAYNILALPAAAFGLIGPWEAAIGMAASSFVVVLNSARLSIALRG